MILQVFSAVRGYVWRDKFYGTVTTLTDTLYIEPLMNKKPVNTKFVRGINRTVNAYVYRVFSKKRSHKKKSKDKERALRLYKEGRWKELKRKYKKLYLKLKRKYLKSVQSRNTKISLR